MSVLTLGDVTVSLGKSLNEEFLTCEARNLSAAFNGVRWKFVIFS